MYIKVKRLIKKRDAPKPKYSQILRLLCTNGPILVPPDLSLVEHVLDYYKKNREFLETFEPKRNEKFFH